MRSRCCLCVSVSRQRLGKKNPLNVTRQQLGRNVTAVKNTHATMVELLDETFSMWPVKESRRLVLRKTSFRSHVFVFVRKGFRTRQFVSE
jgi:hypothetical protein